MTIKLWAVINEGGEGYTPGKPERARSRIEVQMDIDDANDRIKDLSHHVNIVEREMLIAGQVAKLARLTAEMDSAS